ncbi:hypothetical protein, partial [Acrocarpospora pleiomorpha]|uniref:hypothetical protein n=1 Tax=Acrocarpospora pleiomorpha TaxID=90975 RepID=UPI001478D53C
MPIEPVQIRFDLVGQSERRFGIPQQRTKRNLRHRRLRRPHRHIDSPASRPRKQLIRQPQIPKLPRGQRHPPQRDRRRLRIPHPLTLPQHTLR